jgi:hypothetical protein
MQKLHTSYNEKLRSAVRKLRNGWIQYWRRNVWHKIIIILVGLLLAWLGVMYGIARWYIHTSSSKPLIIGTSFIPAYAEGFGLDAKETMDAFINDLGVRHFRLVSYWSQLEPQEGKYDFSLLDWQFEKAEAANAKVTLSLGLRQPRWPECHAPDWAKKKPIGEVQPQLEAFMAAVVQRYKDSPALASYQVENEFFLKGFGRCEEFFPGSLDRSRLVSEYKLVKRLDPNRKIIINRSNNALGWPVGEPMPDEFGISIYKRVWDSTLTKRYLEYPFPAWYYAFVAGWQKIFTGRDMIIHELQAESWGPHGTPLSELSVEEVNKSFDAARFKDRIAFGKATGMREMYLWSGEYWYYMLKQKDDPSLWNVAKNIFSETK